MTDHSRLYRGTPEPEGRPEPRDFGVVFFSTDPGEERGAGQYGRHVAAYDAPHLALLDTRTPAAKALAERFSGRRFPARGDWEDAFAEFYMFPTAEFAAYLKSKGWDGFQTGSDVAVVDPSVLTPVRESIDDMQLDEEEVGRRPATTAWPLSDYARVREAVEGRWLQNDQFTFTNGWIDPAGKWTPLAKPQDSHEAAACRLLGRPEPADPASRTREACQDLLDKGWRRVLPYGSDALLAQGGRALTPRQFAELRDRAIEAGYDMLYDDVRGDGSGVRVVWSRSDDSGQVREGRSRRVVEGANERAALAKRIISLVYALQGISAEDKNSAHQVKLYARNDERISSLLPQDEDEEEAVMAEVARLVDAREDRKFSGRRAKLRKAAPADPSDPLAHFRAMAKGKSWDQFKAAVRPGDGVLDDETIEGVFDSQWNARRGATFAQAGPYLAAKAWRLSDARDWGVWSSDPGGDQSKREQTEIAAVYFGGEVPDVVTVYRGVSRPDSRIQPGDYCTLDRDVARAYATGPYGAVLTEKLPARDLLVDKSSRGATELVYWPEGSKPPEREAPPTTLRALWAEENGISEQAGEPQWRVTVQRLDEPGAPEIVQIDKIGAGGRGEGSFSPEDLAAQGVDVPDLEGLPTGQWTFQELRAMGR